MQIMKFSAIDFFKWKIIEDIKTVLSESVYHSIFQSRVVVPPYHVTSRHCMCAVS